MLVMARISSATRSWSEMTILMVLTLDLYKSISEHILQDVFTHGINGERVYISRLFAVILSYFMMHYLPYDFEVINTTSFAKKTTLCVCAGGKYHSHNINTLRLVGSNRKEWLTKLDGK